MGMRRENFRRSRSGPVEKRHRPGITFGRSRPARPIHPAESVDVIRVIGISPFCLLFVFGIVGRFFGWSMALVATAGVAVALIGMLIWILAQSRGPDSPSEDSTHIILTELRPSSPGPVKRSTTAKPNRSATIWPRCSLSTRETAAAKNDACESRWTGQKTEVPCRSRHFRRQ
jgi:hypothetical protein